MIKTFIEINQKNDSKLGDFIRKNLSASLRVFTIIIGVVSVSLAIAVIMLPDVAIFILTTLLAIGLFVSGVRRIGFGLTQKKISSVIRVFRFSVGFVGVLLSLFVLFVPGIGTTFLLLFLAIGLLLQGVSRVSIGYVSKEASLGMRAFYLIIGLITLLFSAIVIVNPDLGLMTLVLLLAFVLLVNGIGSIFSALLGIDLGYLAKRE
ncbi:hypothetical protein AKJ56_00260 [candidate division MSBL1 archaeon SCGC-AAA382N08]|uniref:DUF308 domain-containing protein n=1 Tax=candidate division MSBL1 archaeon SCGC-AAA382N08 TaxID=1698285 RepID=A0A133VQV1_9EURY|nr:hypothetical protein AKJ56_00260 [candidate division MSBL1 archaeon SCGC-AAA382N08]